MRKNGLRYKRIRYKNMILELENEELRVMDNVSTLVFSVDTSMLVKHGFRLEKVANEFMVLD